METSGKAEVEAKVRSIHASWCGILCALVAALVAWAMVVPSPAAADAEHIVIPVVDEPVTFDFTDPCRGGTLHAEGTENGIIRFTELGDQGHHLRLNVRGVAELFDDAGNFVGTLTYHLRLGDQFPPDGQGAFQQVSVGHLEYADGSRAIVQLHEHIVFGKGDVIKREFFKTTCGGG